MTSELAAGSDSAPLSVDGSITVDVGRWFRQELFLGALLPTALGAAGVVAAAVGATTGSTGVRVVVGVLGAVFLAVGLGLYFWLFARTPHTWLDIDGSGLALRDDKGVRWQLAWSETSAVSVVRTRFWIERVSAGARGRTSRLVYPRHHLRLKVDATAAARPGIARALSGPYAGRRVLTVNLGVPGGTARSVLAALGPHASPPEIVRLRSRFTGPEDERRR